MKRFVGDAPVLPELPPPDTRRWVTRRKAQVVSAVEVGLLPLREACDRYALSIEEFLSWQNAVARYGLAGLRVTAAQEHRRQRFEMQSPKRKAGAVRRTPHAVPFRSQYSG